MNDMPYFTERTRPALPQDQLVLGKNFWIAWRQIVRDYGTKNYLCEQMGDSCCDGHPTGSSESAVQRKVFLELGDAKWPTDDSEIPEDQGRIFDFIEFFGRFVSKPTSSWYHSFCGDHHPTAYDPDAGRQEYEAEVNRLFKKMRHPYRVKNGEVRLENSPLLDTPLANIELQTDDDHLKGLVDSAIRDFQDRSGTRKSLGLRQMVDAFERLKTIKDDDKKRSVAKVINGLSPEDHVRSALNDDMKELTGIANNFCIRHHERGKKPLVDEDMIEFLFYQYFNYVRLILKKHNMLKAAKVESTEVPAADKYLADGEIPF